MAVDWVTEVKNVVGGRGSASASSVLVYPPVLDEDDQISTVHFFIDGIEDVGFERGNTGSQRLARNGDSLINNSAEVLSTIYGEASDWLTSFRKKGAGAAIGDTLSGLSKYGAGFGSDFLKNSYALGKDVNTAMLTAGDTAKLRNKVTRLDTHIVLPMPEDGISAKYGVNYDSANMGMLGALGNGMANGQTAADVVRSSGGAMIRGALGGAVGYVGDMPKAGIKGIGNPNAAFDAGTRQTLNPRKEQLFNSVDYRRFHYSYVFTPSTQEECLRVRDIIYTFKRHMHPSLELNGFYYKYPSEFTIEYRFKGKTNKWTNTIASCALESMSVHYGHGGWSTLVNGSPTSVSIRLNFLELAPVTRQDIEQSKY